MFKLFVKSTLCVLLLFSVFSHTDGYGYTRLSGSLELDYAHYEAEEASVDVVDADSFFQKYHLVYEKKGLFLNGRAGRYVFLLGVDVFDLDSEVENLGSISKFNISEVKSLYQGDLTFAPGGLPFNLHLYSRDMSRIKPERDQFLPRGNFESDILTAPSKSILTPNITDDMLDGQRIESGASMVLGIRNGSYLGRYRNILSNLPKLFFDYREVEVKDLESRTPEYYKDKDLAFVSLNKKNNWFHYRVFDHEDKINPLENYSDYTFLVGTVNQYYQREWVNLTNWIQLSTDMGYYKHINPRNDLGVEREYAINFFVRTSRERIHSTVMSRFSRLQELNSLQKRVSIPVFINGTIDRSTSWNFQFVGDSYKQNRPFSLVSSETTNDNAYSSILFNVNKQKRFIISPKLEMEYHSETEGDGYAVRGSLSAATNNKHDLKYDFFEDLRLSYYNGELKSSVTSLVISKSDFFEVSNSFDIINNIDSRTRVGLSTDLVYGSGEYTYSFARHFGPRSEMAMRQSNRNSSISVNNDIEKIFVSIFGDKTSSSRLRNHIELSYEILNVDGKSSEQTTVWHSLGKKYYKYKFRMSNGLVYGDAVSRPFEVIVVGASVGITQYDGLSYSHISEIEYRQNRNWRHSAKVNFELRDPKNNDGGLYVYISQDSNYTHHKKVGLRRKFFTLRENAEYEMIDLDNGETASFGLISIRGDIYPTSWAYLGSKIKYQGNLDNGSDELGFGLYAGLDFSKLDVLLEYEKGMRTADDIGTVLERDEQRWKLNVKKMF